MSKTVKYGLREELAIDANDFRGKYCIITRWIVG